MDWRDKKGNLATPSNISRRLRELAAAGVLEVQIRRGHAHYRLKQADATLFQIIWLFRRTQTLWHCQQTTEFIDMSGKAQCLGLQYAYGGAPVAQFCQLGDAVIESGQLGKEPVKLLLDWRPPSSVSLNHNGLRLLHAESLAYSVPEVPLFYVFNGSAAQ